MKNIKIERTNTGSWIVKADTKRFGNDEIVFEGINSDECKAYIVREASLVLRYGTEEQKEDAYETIMKYMPDDKRSQMLKQYSRNAYLTSFVGLEHTNISFYDEGTVVYMKGCQSEFRMFIDRDGNFKRKPSRRKMSKADIKDWYTRNWEHRFVEA